ncbi:MAG: hypothetical protein WC099_03630 [Candidatus Paceibacterota bacterium]
MKKTLKIILFVLVFVVLVCTVVLLIDNKKAVAPTEQSTQQEVSN